MLLPRLLLPLRAAVVSIGRSTLSKGPETCLNGTFSQPSFRGVPTSFVPIRHASHKAQGAVNKAKDGPGKRLGAKKSGEQYVIPGNIIFRQRGTHWFPGDNCAMGRDHTIYATQPGYVKYYKDPEKHPKRQYIGVVFERNQVLPLPRNASRRRRLGMVATKMEMCISDSESQIQVQIGGHIALEVEVRKDAVQYKKERKGEEGRNLTLRPGYMYREGNWEIGRAVERANVKVREYNRKDRWAAWRKATKRQIMKAERLSLGKRKGR